MAIRKIIIITTGCLVGIAMTWFSIEFASVQTEFPTRQYNPLLSQALAELIPMERERALTKDEIEKIEQHILNKPQLFLHDHITLAPDVLIPHVGVFGEMATYYANQEKEIATEKLHTLFLSWIPSTLSEYYFIRNHLRNYRESGLLSDKALKEIALIHFTNAETYLDRELHILQRTQDDPIPYIASLSYGDQHTFRKKTRLIYGKYFLKRDYTTEIQHAWHLFQQQQLAELEAYAEEFHHHNCPAHYTNPWLSTSLDITTNLRDILTLYTIHHTNAGTHQSEFTETSQRIP